MDSLKKKLLIIVDGFDNYNPKNANAICFLNLLPYLAKVFNLEIITTTENATKSILKNEWGIIHFIPLNNLINNKASYRRWKSQVLHYILNNFSLNLFDIVLTFSFPFVNHYIGLALKLKSKKIKWVTYDLDPYSFNKLLSNYYLGFPLRFIREIIVFIYADKILLTHELFRSYVKSIFFLFRSKFTDIGIPMLKVKKQNNKNNVSHTRDKAYALYIGKFYSKFRNPNYMIRSLIEIMKTDYNLVLYIVGMNNSSYLDLYNSNVLKRVKFLPRVSRNVIARLIKNSLVLVNIGNSLTNQLPSKILEYIGYGKPIINFYSSKKDTSNFYLSNYPNSIQINQNQDFNENICKIESFLSKSRTNLLKTFSFKLPENLITYKLDKVAERLINALSSF